MKSASLAKANLLPSHTNGEGSRVLGFRILGFWGFRDSGPRVWVVFSPHG